MSCENIGNPNLTIINDLSGSLEEVSGLAKLPGDSHLYAINDSGNASQLFQLNEEGDIMNVFDIPDAVNKDWEDLAYDQKGFIYIGDFGNNRNKRKNLTIYKIKVTASGVDSSDKITFTFPKYKKMRLKRSFNIEAFIYFKKYLYLFSKNRRRVTDQKVRVYRVPANPGTYKAEFLQSFPLCGSDKKCVITAAAINEKNDKIALLTHDTVFLVSGFNSESLFDGNIQKIDLGHYSQKEGICFKNDTILYIVDEREKTRGGYLYQLKLTPSTLPNPPAK